ncbi:SIMPL domain-containing protein [Chitinophaga sedimenti]|uniref:SIMPL domain-containing protein n=1 Tax=Chitinophaga sedimenti TaxID=2033606 RepID=UPI002004F158|nr:SIMPL domain-containing protein [Chitinophaga sedimenti]MCK7558994.1 SIMPL domain-containing protein [Chitinophaga sedimenti]
MKKIEVTASAELEITPDELYFNISLREYFKTKTNKVDISTLEQQLQKAVQAAGIPKENFTIENAYGYNGVQWWKKKKPTTEEFLARKQYRLKLADLKKINGILAGVDEEGIESVNIASFNHSKMEEFRKQVKINAIKAAKTKAEYLAAAADEKLDGVLEIQEIPTDSYADARPMVAFSNARMAAGDAVPQSDIDVKTIKIRGEMRVVYKIK